MADQVQTAFLQLADAAAAAGSVATDAAAQVPEEEKPGAFGLLVLAVQNALIAIHTLYKNIGEVSLHL